MDVVHNCGFDLLQLRVDLFDPLLAQTIEQSSGDLSTWRFRSLILT